MANYDLNNNKYLKNRLQFHAASRIGIQTGQALAQATNGDGHIVTHKSVWSAPEREFVKHTNDAMKTTSDGIAATKDLVSVFEDGAHAYGEDLITYPNESKLPTNLAGKVFVNPAFPAVELYKEVEMTGVSGSNGSGQQFEAYEVLNGTSRVKNFIPPTAVSDNGLPVPGYTGRVEVFKDNKWTDLENCGDVSGAWALAEGNWEFVYMSGMVTFHPDYTPIGKKYTKVRFTGFKYIGETLDTTLDDLEGKITGGISGDLSELQDLVSGEIANRKSAISDLEEKDEELEGRISANKTAIDVLNGDVSTAGSVAKALDDAKKYADGKATDLQAEIAKKVDAVAGFSLVADTEITKLSKYPEYSAITESIGTKANAADVYTKTDADAAIASKIATAIASVFEYKGSVADMATLEAVTEKKKGDVYHVTAGKNGASAEYVYNGEAWEELGTAIDLSAYATIASVDEKVGAEKTRAEKAEADLRNSVAAAAAKAAANEAAIGVLNSDANVTGSVAAAVKAETDRALAAEKKNSEDIAKNAAAIDIINGSGAGSLSDIANAVAVEKGRAEGVEAELRKDVDENNAAIELLNGADTEDGSIAKAVKEAVDAEAKLARAAEQENAGAIAAEIANRQTAFGNLDTAIGAEITRATGIEAGLRTDVNAAKDAIEVLNGVSTVKGSVDAKVAAETTRATEVEAGLRKDVDANRDAITVLNGADNVEDSVAYKIKEAVDAESALRAKDYEDVDKRLDSAEADIDAIETLLPKADFAGTTVKAEIAKKVDAVAGSSLVADTEITKLAAYPAYSVVEGNINAKVTAEEGKGLVLTADITKLAELNDQATTDAVLAGKVDVVEGSGLIEATKVAKLDDLPTNVQLTNLLGGKVDKNGTDRLMTVVEGDKLNALPTKSGLDTLLANKVDKVTGSSLVADAQITKLEGLKDQATIDEYLAGKIDKQPLVSVDVTTLEAGKRYVVIDAFEGTLPSDAANGSTVEIFVLVGGAGKTVTAPTGETILGQNLPCAIGISEEGWQLDNESYIFVKNGSNWHVL